nr:MAG TPA: hypothetical protein [Caudoviricetes sp.]
MSVFSAFSFVTILFLIFYIRFFTCLFSIFQYLFYNKYLFRNN